MKQVAGVWIPDDEQHLVSHLTDQSQWVDGRGTYQYRKLKVALDYVTNWNVAVDVGACWGLWSMHLIQKFGFVHAFEPVANYHPILRRNVGLATRTGQFFLDGRALGSEQGNVRLETGPNSGGDTFVDPDGPHKAAITTLDDVFLAGLDFLKIDCEGYELFVLQGGEATIRRFRPAIIVEQKPGHAERYGLGQTDAVALLQGWGAKLRAEISGDFILSWDR